MKTKDKLNAKVVELNEEDIEQVSGGSNVLEELKKKNEEMKEKYNSSIGTDFPEADLNFQNVDLR